MDGSAETQPTETPDPQHTVKIEKFQKELRIQLSAEEFGQRAERAAHLIGEIEQKEDDRKAANTAAKSRIEELQAELKRVSGEVRDKAKYGIVDCERRFIFRTGRVQEVRKDTGAVLDEWAMTADERQMELDLDDPEENDDEPPIDLSQPVTGDRSLLDKLEKGDETSNGDGEQKAEQQGPPLATDKPKGRRKHKTPKPGSR